MLTLRTAYFLVILTMVASERRFHGQTNDPFPEVQESTLSQRNDMMDTITPVINVKSGLSQNRREYSEDSLQDLKRSNRGIVSPLIDIGLTNWEAIKEAILIGLNTLSSEIATLTEEVKNADITDLLASPHINRLLKLLTSLLTNSSLLKNFQMVTDPRDINGIRTETAASREYSSSDSTSSMQRPSSSAASFSLFDESSL